MSWKTTILILVLALVTAGLLYLALKNPKVNQPVATQQPASPAQTTLSMSEEQASPSSQHVIDVNIDTRDNKVTATQLELSYDPTVITNVSLQAGTFFTTPTILLNNVDKNNGRISYALAVQLANGPQRGTGVVARVLYDTVPGSTGSATISFLPKTQVTAEGIIQSVLKSATGISIQLPTVGVQPLGTRSAQ